MTMALNALSSARAVAQALAGWPVSSQQAARRNALVASTALAERRRERLEVEAFLEAATHRHEVRQRRAEATA